MLGRFTFSALALTITITVITGKESVAQTGGDPGSHLGKAASSVTSAGQKPPESVIKKENSGNDLEGLELFGPGQESDTSFSRSPVSNTELERYIENCLKKDPTMSGTNVRVAVTDDQINLSGNVAKAKEKQTAGRIAQSFGGNKKLVNQISIGEPATSQTPKGNGPSPKSTPQDPRAAPSMTAQPKNTEPPPLR